MKQALIALIRETLTGKAADAQRSAGQTEQRAASAIRVLDRSEMRQVSGGGGGGGGEDSPKRGWTAA